MRRWNREENGNLSIQKREEKRYGELNNQLRRETDKAKGKWWEEQCKELEQLDKIGRTDLLYRKVSNLTKAARKRKLTPCIRDKEGNKLTEPADVCSRWKEYLEELYDKENKPEEEALKLEKHAEADKLGPEILYSEFEKALLEVKSGKIRRH